MNAYWKHNLKYSKRLHLPRIKSPTNDISSLSCGLINIKGKLIIGRSWKSDELRLKSDSDLHKLWYVLLKEKLALKSDMYDLNIRENEKNKVIKTCMQKVSLSMSRLRSVMGERTQLRNEFMSFLEFWYIRKMQNREHQGNVSTGEKSEKVAEEPHVENVRVVSTTTPTNPEKVVIRGAIEDTTVSDTVSVLDEKEQKIVKNITKQYNSQKELLKDFVKNTHYLKGKEKRIAASMINRARSKLAREIMMKELSAISYKLKNTEQSKNPKINKLENLA
jgi:hypothetical protein